MKAAILLFTAATLCGCAHAPAEGSRATFEGELRGPLQSVDPYEGRITIATPTGPVDLWSTPHTRLIGPTGAGWVKLSELRAGEVVRADFQLRANGTRELSWLQLLSEEVIAPAETALPSLPSDEEPVNPPAGGLAPTPIGQP